MSLCGFFVFYQLQSAVKSIRWNFHPTLHFSVFNFLYFSPYMWVLFWDFPFFWNFLKKDFIFFLYALNIINIIPLKFLSDNPITKIFSFYLISLKYLKISYFFPLQIFLCVWETLWIKCFRDSQLWFLLLKSINFYANEQLS